MTKPTKWHVRPAKTQINLGIRPVWSESLLCALWVAKDPSFLHADSEDSNQTGRMLRLICPRWAHMPFCWFCHAWLIWTFCLSKKTDFWNTLIIQKYLQYLEYSIEIALLVWRIVLKWTSFVHKVTYKMACAPSEHSDQSGHPPSLIRVYAVLMKNALVISYLFSAQQRLWSDWADAKADLSLCLTVI